MVSLLFFSNFGTVKARIYIMTMVFGILSCMPNIVFAKPSQSDSLLLERVFSYDSHYANNDSDVQRNMYLRFSMKTDRRNFLLMFIPSMYNVSRGKRKYIAESYSEVSFKSISDYNVNRRLVSSTIPHHKLVQTAVNKHLVPDLYGETISSDCILSPFNRLNRRMYRYRINNSGNGTALITVRPRTYNTMLVRGWAQVETSTGKIMVARLKYEYDMLKIDIMIEMDEHGHSIIPHKVKANCVFSFLGNKITSQYNTYFDSDTTMVTSSIASKDTSMLTSPDISNNYSIARASISAIRIDSLTDFEKSIYHEYDVSQVADTATSENHGGISKMARETWRFMGDNLFGRITANNSRASLRISPILNPFYLSYSNRKGLSYKMRIGASYSLSDNSQLLFNPRFGYNFKIKRFFFNAPLRYVIDWRHNIWLETSASNGNRITNSDILDMIKEEHRDTINFDNLDLDYFTDNIYEFKANVRLFNCLDVTPGIIFHNRVAVNKYVMGLMGKETLYRSFAPTLSLSLRPTSRSPLYTLSYERGVKGVMRSNLEYERIEMDVTHTLPLHCLRKLDTRLGGGFYTNRKTKYFVDFVNFRDNYLSSSWNEDWSGDFHLVKSEWYNASRWYVRYNATYETPMLVVSWLPLVGRFVESERIYLNLLQLERTPTYAELGYGFSNRIFSMGLFTNIMNGEFGSFGAKFSFELFNRW